MPLNKITVDSLAANAVTNVAVANGTIVSVDLADGSVIGPKIGLTSINANNIVDGVITPAKLSVTPGSSGNVLTSNGTSWVSQAAAAFDSGTRMIFGQTSAPTGWTKDTTNYNNHALRIVTGAASTGGTIDFTSVFANTTPTITVSAISGSAGATTLTTPQIPSHTHTAAVSGNPAPISGVYTVGSNPGNTGATGGGGSHTHPFTFSSGTATSSAIALAVKYLDVITATKN